MLDWTLSQNGKNTLPLHAVHQLARSAKTYLDAVVPDEVLTANADAITYQIK